MTVEEAWPAFAEADESRDLDDIKAALAQLCGAYHGKTWQELEKKLRQEKCNTYLVAVVRIVFFLLCYSVHVVFASPRLD
jgi:hypothetical protein